MHQAKEKPMTATVMGFSFAWCIFQVAYNDFTCLSVTYGLDLK